MSVSRSIGWALLIFAATAALAPACHVYTPNQGGPDRTCHQACRKQAAAVCGERECWRGCDMVLDRIIEHETGTVLACIAQGTRGCDDVAWAECAARVGPHKDGGPAAPTDDIIEDD